MANIQVIQQSIDVIGLLDVSNLQVLQQSIDVIGLVDQPSLQVSKQDIQVAGIKTGEVRVDRVYLEILATYHSYSIEDELTLTSNAFLDEILFYPNNTLSLTQDAIPSLVSSNAENILELIQVLEERHIPETSGNSSISFSQDVNYIGPKYVNSNNILSITQSARITELYEPIAASELDLTQTVSIHGKLNYNASSSLILSQYADTIVKIRGYLQELDLTQSVDVSLIKFAYNTLELTQTLSQGIMNIWASNTLELNQEVLARQTIIKETIEHNLNVLDTVDIYPYYGRSSNTLYLDQNIEITVPQHLSADNELITTSYEIIDNEIVEVYTGLDHTVTLEGSIANRSFNHYIQWAQTVDHVLIKGTAVSKTLTSNLSLNQEARLSKAETASNILTLNQIATGMVAKPISNTLSLEQEATLNKVQNRFLYSNLNIESSFRYLKDDVETCTYDPTFGSQKPRSFSNNLNFDKQDHIILFYPFNSPTNTIELRTPDFGNTNNIEFQRINRRTRGGTLIIWADTQWPKNEKISLRIQGLTELKCQEYLDFVTTSLGKELGFIDWENNIWKGILLNPNEPFNREKRNNFSINIELELTWTPINCIAYSELILTSSISKQKIINKTANNYFISWQSANHNNDVKTQSLEHPISLTDVVKRTFDESLDNSLSLNSQGEYILI